MLQASNELGEGGSVGFEEAIGFARLSADVLFQTSFLLFLIQVYFLPKLVLTRPSFLHAAPTLTTAFEIEGLAPTVKEAINTKARVRFILKVYSREITA